MDRRSWPWKKKTLDKNATAADIVAPQGDQDNNKKQSYIQISYEQYSLLSNLKDEVKRYEEQVRMLEDQTNDLNEKLSAANADITAKESLVKQHSKVAEEAVSGWEKAEAEASSLKTHLESVTLSKLTAEDRAEHLDGALKECMRQIRSLKEENEQKLQDVIVTKTNQMDKLRAEFESKIADFDQELMRAETENDTLSRSLQERSNMLIRISEEKSQAESEIEHLKNNIESCEREINSLKYEVHVISKELEIRNEEKNMSMRSAEAANKQNMENVKKVAKLEAECQRLRGLVRKKLPGPAALAQMKMEVECLGREYGDSRLRRSPIKPSSPLMSPMSHMSQISDFSLDNIQKFHKEADLMTHQRLLAMEEETKMLKEALAKRNNELQASRNLCTKTVTKLQALEAQLMCKSPMRSGVQTAAEIFSGQHISKPPSVASMSEDGNEDARSFAASWSTAVPSELYQSNRDKNSLKLSKSESVNHLELMDDFLEMEKLANLPSETHELAEKEIAMADDETGGERLSVGKVINKELSDALSHIHGFVSFLSKEAKVSEDSFSETRAFCGKLEEFSVTFDKVLRNEKTLAEFVFDLACVLLEARELKINVLGFSVSEVEIHSPNCIDKVALPENREIKKDSSMEHHQNGCSDICSSTSDTYGSENGNVKKTSECKFTEEEFEELKLEKTKAETDLASVAETLEETKSTLKETEEQLAQVKSQLESAQESNSLVGTQLKCMAESYRSLESRSAELESELSSVKEKLGRLETELEDEKNDHGQTMTKCRQLQEELQRTQDSLACSAADATQKNRQDKEIADAAGKLAECQETILLLGKQLKSMRPHVEQQIELNQSPEGEAGVSRNGFNAQEMDQTDEDKAINASDQETTTTKMMRSPVASKHSKHKHSRSSVSSSSSTGHTPEKHSRGIGRFFSSKAK